VEAYAALGIATDPQRATVDQADQVLGAPLVAIDQERRTRALGLDPLLELGRRREVWAQGGVSHGSERVAPSVG
jgi:hypothetical protein